METKIVDDVSIYKSSRNGGSYIDKRTIEGKRVCKKVKSIDVQHLKNTGYEFGVHPYLTMLSPVEKRFMHDSNSCQN